MTTSSEQQNYRFIASFDPSFADLAVEEIRRAAPSLRSESDLAPGISLFTAGDTFTDLVRYWRESPPVFVRHVCPVDAVVELVGTDEDVAAIERSALDILSGDLNPEVEFSVQCRVLDEVGFKPYDVNTRLAAALSSATGASVNVRNPQQVVSVVCALDPSTQDPSTSGGVAYLGLSNVGDNLSDWAGGMRRFAREAGQVSRSEFKLLEALEVFQAELLPRGVALDLGAAPGGWTRVLRQHEQYVTAVDPGALHESVRADPGVRHLEVTAEDYLNREPDSYDLIVNDMRMDGRDSARLMVRYADYLQPDGQVIMTIKLPERKRISVIEHSLAILGRAYTVLGMKQLFHNRSEITLHLALRSPQSTSGV